MLLRILKNDLRHKKVTNIILLMFIAMAAMFVSGSVNSMITIVTAQRDFFDNVGVYDYSVLLRDEPDGEAFEKAAKKFKNSDGYIREAHLVLPADGIEKKDGKDGDFSNVTLLSSPEKLGIKLYDGNDKRLESIPEGKMYVPQKTIDTGSLEIGDEVTVKIGGKKLSLTVAGTVKDAIFGSPFVGVNRFFVSEKEYELLNDAADGSACRCSLMGFESGDTDALVGEVVETNVTTFVNFSRSELESSCIMDLIVAAMFLLVSVVLIVVSFVVLSFTIKFTLDQEFREIGVMKAIGVPDKKTEGMYLVKYIFLAAVGAALGFAGGIPFANVLAHSSAGNTVIEGGNTYLVNLGCVLLVMLIVVLFCCGRVRALRKYTPVDAVRSGNNGETYSKKSRLSLSKTRLRPAAYLSATDILSNPKTFVVMAVTFTLCLMITIVVVDTISTLRSDSMVSWMSICPSDAFLCSNELQQDVMTESGSDVLRDTLSDVEKRLDENGMSGDVHCEVSFYLNYQSGDVKMSAVTVQGVGSTADRYTYLRGTAPQNKNEIAMTPQVAKVLGVDIGDTVILTELGGEHEMLVTALFQTMMNMGNGVRIHEDMELGYIQSAGCLAVQVDFDDEPGERQLRERLDKLGEIFPEYKVRTGDGYIDDMIGVAPIIEKVKLALLPILLIVCVLVTVLMERSLIARDKGEIAMLKASGFSDGFIIRRDMLRTALVMLVSALIAIPLSTPFAQISSAFGFKAMGAQAIKFDVPVLEAYVIYPAIFLTATLAAVFFTSLSTKKITANQTAGIE